MKMVVVEVMLHRGRLPTGRLLSLGETSARRAPAAYMLITEKVLEEELMTGKFQGIFIVQFRTGEPIHEAVVPSQGTYLGSAAGYHFFERVTE